MLFIIFLFMLFVYPPLAFFMLIIGIGAKVFKK